MNLICQRSGECHLAAIAMLAGLDQQAYEQLSDAVKETFGISWADCERSMAMNVVVKIVGIPINAVDAGCSFTSFCGVQKDPDLSGKGHLVIVWSSCNAHSTAYENGLIFDPNATEPMTLEEWKEFSKTTYSFYGEVVSFIVQPLVVEKR